jgi:FkbM family methyltransferase
MSIRILGLNPRNFWRLFNLDRIIYYRTRSINKILAYSKLPDGCVAIHFWDSLPTLDLIYFSEIYDRLRKIEEKDTVIDCGAHVGIFTLKAAKRAKNGLVVAVEPEILNYGILKSNVENNALTNVITIKNVLTNKKSRRIRLYLHPSLSEGHSLNIYYTRPHTLVRYIMVQSTTLDNLAKACEIDCADVIKISVTGAELDVIKGGQKLLKESKYIAMEYDKDISRIKELTNLLLKQGFKKVSQMDNLSPVSGWIFFRRCHVSS